MSTLKKLLLLLCILSAGYASASDRIPLADPFILYENGLYYAYGTGSDQGIPVYVSRDLRTWTPRGLALHKKNTNIPRFFWAPEVYKVGNEYYMYFSGNEHLYVARSSTPLGPFIQVGTSPMLHEKAIDSSIFYSKSHKPYIVFVRMNDGNNIWIAPLRKDMVSLDSIHMKHCFSVSQKWEESEGRVNEGPGVFFRNGKYYMIYSANDYRSQNYGLGLASARKPEGPWKKRADNPFLQKPDTLVGVGHNSVFTDRDGKLRIVFHAHANRHKVQPRYMYIGTVDFPDSKDDGKIQIKDIFAPKKEDIK